MAQVNAMIREAKISINTFGKFFIRQGDILLSDSSSRSRRMWEVFKYLLSNRDKSFYPEDILDNIWPDKDYADPGTAMRAQMFRLRQALKADDLMPSLSANIIFSQGCYRWENKIDCWIDADQFEAYCEQAQSLIIKDPEQAILLYRKAINLYKGKYLPESSYSEWIEPIRVYYHDLYLNAVFAVNKYFKRKKDFSAIIQTCEQAATIDYFDERIHISMLEALIADGQTTRARVHYNEVTSAYYREMGIKPSNNLKNLYRQIGAEEGHFELDLSAIQDGLKDKETVEGAYYCDPGLFRYFYKMERLRNERNGQSILLCLLTLTAPDSLTAPADKLKNVMFDLQDTIMSALRKGDLFTKWNDAQFLMLLPGLNKEQAMNVMARIEKLYSAKYSLEGLTLRKKVDSLLPLEGDAHFS
jgi:two-component SAPR family response regulator